MELVLPYNTQVIKLLIFDLDGTLIDSAPDIIATVHELSDQHQKPRFPDEKIVASIGEGLKALVFSLFAESQPDSAFLQAIEKDFMTAYNRNLALRTKAFAGAEDFLKTCELKIAIVTNKNKALADKTLATLGLDRYNWVRVFGADSLSEKKPHPLPLQEVMRIAGVEPHETVMIGDGIPDMKAAQSAGVRSIAVEFGYLPKETLLQLGAVASLASFKDLGTLIKSLDK